MDIGVVIPQGYFGEYPGWEPRVAWQRTVALARQADELGFDSAWLYDHVHTAPEQTDELTFEATTSLAAIAVQTNRIRLGQLVLYAGFRQPALVAAMVATTAAASGGRFELGIGAGWKEQEILAYGYPFPPPAARMATLDRHLTWLRRRFPAMRIVIGGNGPHVTFRLAARDADELNLNLLSVEAVATALPVVSARCEEIGRDPATLRTSVQLRGGLTGEPGAERVDRIAAYRDLGLSRVMFALQLEAAVSDEAFESLAADALAAGARLEPFVRRAGTTPAESAKPARA